MSNPITGVFPAAIVARLDDVEKRLALQGQSRDARLGKWTGEALGAGGKRIRPLLLLTAFEACGGDKLGPQAQSDAIDSAVALELVHAASLVHDDIMDESKERRGQPSTYAAHGRDGAILVGDYLFTQAFALAAKLPKDAMAMTADACRRLCEGQMLEQELLASGKPDREAYVRVIRDKTAALLAAGCGIGATMAHAPAPTVQSLHAYGNAMGHAFQILDDVLDVSGDPQWTGKAAGTDYLAGTITSPYLHFIERGGQVPARRDAKEFPGMRARLLESGAVAASQLEASSYTQAALLEVERLPPSTARSALERLAELLMERAQ
ncbi:MAG: polyprenyl synthetase family protein [bacterium]